MTVYCNKEKSFENRKCLSCSQEEQLLPQATRPKSSCVSLSGPLSHSVSLKPASTEQPHTKPPIHQQGQDEWKLQGKLAILQNEHDRIGQYLTNDLNFFIVTVVYSFVVHINQHISDKKRTHTSVAPAIIYLIAGMHKTILFEL